MSHHHFIRDFHSATLDKIEEVSLPESFIKTAAATRKDRSLIINQCVACYADLSANYIPYIAGGKFPPENGLVRVVLMNNRLLGGLGFPGGKMEAVDASFYDAAMREFNEETSIDLKSFIETKYALNVEENAVFFYETNIHCLSGMHLVKVSPEGMCLLMNKINKKLMDDSETLFVDIHQNRQKNSCDLLFKELCTVSPIVLTPSTFATTLARSSAYTLVARQLQYLLNNVPYDHI
jgi:ADP-ribose pyrophosphatase YjhB (NUDIX family)